MTEPSEPLIIDPCSEHFRLYRSENAFGKTLSLERSRYPELLLHQPFNEWSQKLYAGEHAKRNEDHLLMMLETAYRQGRESLRHELTQLLAPGVGRR